MTIIFHKYKPYYKNSNFIILWYITFVRWDTLKMLDNAKRKLDNILYKKPNE
jgi:hypothetical protein